jgi:hypothetical protein
MSGARYVCCEEGRRRALLDGPPDLTGIDFVEVHAGPTTADPTTLVITLVKPVTVAVGTITRDNIRLTGGARFPAPPIDPTVVHTKSAGLVTGYVLTIAGGHPVDFSLHRLALVAGPASAAPPPFIDARLSAVDINFKIACPSDADCAPDCDDTPGAAPTEATFDYRNRDWPGFRQAMLDRLAGLIPGFRGDEPLDLTVTLIEVLAAESDRLSYRLDWIGTEAFLPTARSRTSVARHARLVNYRPGEGVSARCFAGFEFTPGGGVVDGMTLAASTPLLIRRDDLPDVVPASDWPALIGADPLVFETAQPLRLWTWRNRIAFHTWSDDECRLPAGATQATVEDQSGGGVAALVPGDLLLLQEIASPETGQAADASPLNRHVVRLTRVQPVVDKLAPAGKTLVDLAWDAADALPFDLVIQARPSGASSAAAPVLCAVAAGNIVLADHGLSLPPPTSLGLPPSAVEALRPRLLPPNPIPGEVWRPTLDRADLARAPSPRATPGPASTLLDAAPADALPVLKIDDVFSVWTARADLLNSGPFNRDFVVEAGMDGRAQLRFGDDVHGLSPPAGTAFAASGRFGSGLAGNIGGDALGHVVLPLAQQGAKLKVGNPLPARSGADPETLASVRLNAPYAFRKQDRAVTPADYAEVAMRHPEVIAAIAEARWTGAFQTVLVHVDRRGDAAMDTAFLARVTRHMEHFRLMGFDLAVRPAVMAPLDIELFICAMPGRLRGTVGALARDVLRPRRRDGAAGFFDPDRFTFGAPLRLSALVATLMAVDGVQSVEVKTFQRFGRLAMGELEAGVIRPYGAEVLQMADNPSFPERGRLRILMGGGR